MPQEQQLQLPRFDLRRVFRVRDRLLQRELVDYRGFTLRADALNGFVQSLRAVFKVRPDVLRDSVQHLAGRRLTHRDLYVLAWRLAGNIRRLEAGDVVLPWRTQHRLEWAPVQVLEHVPTFRSYDHEWGANYRMRILAGTACPREVVKFWPQRFCALLARRAGYTSRRHGYPFSNIAELVSMRFVVLLDPELSREFPDFNEVGCPSGLRRWNVSIIQKRFRKDGRLPWPCPRDYDHPCHQCPVGYLDCPAATHKETYDVEAAN